VCVRVTLGWPNVPRLVTNITWLSLFTHAAFSCVASEGALLSCVVARPCHFFFSSPIFHARLPFLDLSFILLHLTLSLGNRLRTRCNLLFSPS